MRLLSSVGVVLAVGIAVAVGMAGEPPAAHAQQAAKVSRVGFLENVPPPIFEAFRQALHDLGYREGQNFTIERRQEANVTEDRLPDLAAELVRIKVDVIAAPGPVSLTAAIQGEMLASTVGYRHPVADDGGAVQ